MSDECHVWFSRFVNTRHLSFLGWTKIYVCFLNPTMDVLLAGYTNSLSVTLPPPSVAIVCALSWGVSDRSFKSMSIGKPANWRERERGRGHQCSILFSTITLFFSWWCDLNIFKTIVKWLQCVPIQHHCGKHIDMIPTCNLQRYQTSDC